MIKISGITKTYQMGEHTFDAISDVSLAIEPGDFVAIMGPSGSGKSTLLHILGLLDAPTTGRYELHGTDVSKLDERELTRLRAARIGFIFQQFHLLARTSAALNVGLPMIYDGGIYDEARAKSLLAQVGLAHRTEHKPNELSGGQQQRVAIARALANGPSLILADEPTGALDSQSEEEVMAILAELNARGITVVIVTHEPEIAKRVKRVIRMRDGKIQSDERNPDYREPTTTLGLSVKAKALKAETAPFLRRLHETKAHVRQAIASLRANKIRSILSMLGILVGVGAVIAMLAIGEGAKRSMEAELSVLGSNLLVLRSGSVRSGQVELGEADASRIGASDVEALAKLPGVRAVTPVVSGKVQAVFEDNNSATIVRGVAPAYETIKASQPTEGRFFSDAETRVRARVALLGTTVARELFGTSSPVGATIKINRIAFHVIGLLPEKGETGFGDQDDVIVVPVNTAMRRILGKQYFDSVEIQVIDEDQMKAVEAAVRETMNQRHHVREDSAIDAFAIRNMTEMKKALGSVSRVMALLLATVASISLLVGGIGIMNIMLVTVSERTREIGLRKALGANRHSILSQFLIEAVVITLLGGSLGIVLGWLMAEALTEVTGWQAVVTLSSIATAASFSVFIGIAFGYWPALRAARLHPIEALRRE